jgi:hypothetical protein
MVFCKIKPEKILKKSVFLSKILDCSPAGMTSWPYAPIDDGYLFFVPDPAG